MPLASDRSAAERRSEQVHEESRQRERRERILHGKRRTSLPNTIPSSTVATQAKAQHRLQMMKQRRLSSSTSVSSSTAAKENHPRADQQLPHYSPPETRSAKKKKFFQQTSSSSASMALQFSPPNPKENARREQERIQQQEAERQRRIEAARRNGQLLVFSTASNDNDWVATEDAAAEMTTSNSETDTLSQLTHSEDRTTSNKEELLQKLSMDMAAVVESQREAARSRRNSEADLLKNIQGMLQQQQPPPAVESSESSLALTQLRYDLKEANDKFASEQAAHSSTQTRLTMELEQSQNKVTQLEHLQNQLQRQTVSLTEEKKQLKATVTALERDLQDAKTQLQHQKTLLEALQQEGSQEKQEWAQRMQQLQDTNIELHQELRQSQSSQAHLERSLVQYQETVDRLEKITIPELESALETEKDRAARLEAELDDRTTELEQQSEMQVQQLQVEIQKLQNQYDAEQALVKRLQESNSVAQEKWATKEQDKDFRIAVLTSEIESRQAELVNAQQQVQEARTALEQLQANMVAGQKQLNDALEESMTQLDQVETENRNLEQKLNQALQELNDNTVRSSQTDENVAAERARREQAQQRARASEQMVVQLQHQLQEACAERDLVQSSMKGVSERERELYERLHESDRIRRELHSRMQQLLGNIRVFVRVRPALPQEVPKEDVAKKRKRDGENYTPFSFPSVYERRNKKTASASTGSAVVGSSGDDLTKHALVEITEPYKDRGGLSDRRKQWRFGFDQVFGPDHGQAEVWHAVEPLVQSAIDGFHVTVFAYGQTGSGKTYTMLGQDGSDGLIGRSIQKMFDEKREMESLSQCDTKVAISVELLEVYNEKVRDLLSGEKGQDLKVTSSEVVGNIVVETTTADQVLQVLQLAQSRRCVKATGSNAESSRSHMIFTIRYNVTFSEGERHGRLNICDLAGSERLDKSGAHRVGGALLEESKNINKSLSVLSNVIERLQAGDGNVPFRESKLTWLLKNSLCGNSKTLAIVCCNPLVEHMSESLCSLKFAEKVNRVDLKAEANFSA